MALMASANVGAETGAFEDVGAPAPTPGAHSSGVAVCSCSHGCCHCFSSCCFLLNRFMPHVSWLFEIQTFRCFLRFVQ